MQLSLEQALQLAPDAASAKAAKGLAIAGKWPSLGRSDRALWGECQGSGANPYRTRIDLDGPAFGCTCPSRKFPCKHGLALLMLCAQQADALAVGEPPDWVEEWLASRRQRSARQEDKKSAAAPADPQAAAKRADKRLERMAAGAEDLRLWLSDRIAGGCGALPEAGRELQTLAARMVDAQAPGLAFRVRQLAEIASSGGDWPERLLAAMGRLQLLLDAFGRYAELPPPQRSDVRTALGWPPDKDEVLAQGERQTDVWDVLGCATEENERLWERRAWLRGRASGRYALLLDYAHGTPAFERSFLVGGGLNLTLAYYPGAYPRRALIAEAAQAADAAVFRSEGSASVWDETAAALAAHPWQTTVPMALADAQVQRDATGWLARTAQGERLSLTLADAAGWQLLALSGGFPLGLFGEWNGERLRPLSAWTPGLAWVEGIA